MAHANVPLAVQSGPSLAAQALEAAHLVPTGCPVETRIGGAVINVNLAGGAGVALATVADKFVVEIDAAIRADGIARVTETLVERRLAL